MTGERPRLALTRSVVCVLGQLTRDYLRQARAAVRAARRRVP